MAEKSGPSGVDLEWNDEDVLPPVLSPDTEFVFRRMTEVTLKAADVGPSLRVLDVGCGRGLDAASMAGQGGTLFGCEPSRVMVAKARRQMESFPGRFWVVSSLAETLPFASRSFHRVVCKGAIDHFQSPDRAVSEMCRVTSPAGKVVISVANFESLSCILSRALNRCVERARGRGIPPPHIWEIPRDHTHKFDFAATFRVAAKFLKIESVRGVSLLWGFPRWPAALKRVPASTASLLLRLLDRIAWRYPKWSDVVILVGRPRHHSPARERRI